MSWARISSTDIFNLHPKTISATLEMRMFKLGKKVPLKSSGNPLGVMQTVLIVMSTNDSML